MLYNMRRGGSYGPRLRGPARSVPVGGRALSFLARPLRAVAVLRPACCRVVGFVPCASVCSGLSFRLCSSARLPACRALLPRFAWPFEGGGAAASHHAGLRRRLRWAFHEEQKKFHAEHWGVFYVEQEKFHAEHSGVFYVERKTIRASCTK